MDRDEYLNDEHVAGFVQWLRQVIVVDQGFTQSFKTLNGRGEEVTLAGFRSALLAYDYDGLNVDETQVVLNPLSEIIQQVTRESNETREIGQQHDLLIACLKTLVWGGVTVKVTITWLADYAQQGTLQEVIQVGSRALVGDRLADIEVFRQQGYLRSDSAATKLYAMANPRSIIYDNRVGAALAKLVCEYLDHSGQGGLPESLAFMVKKSKRGRRDPSDANRSFTRKTTGYSHAYWNQRANWIVSDLVQYEDIARTMAVFDGVDTIRALEAALFVMGDDIRKLTVNENSLVQPVRGGVPDDGNFYHVLPEIINGQQVQGYCVPTGHNFGDSIHYLQQFRQQNPGSDDARALRDFIMRSRGCGRNTAIACRSPLMSSHFNLINGPDQLVSCLAEHPLGEEAFEWLQDQWQQVPLRKILLCTWAVGRMFSADVMDVAGQQRVLVERGLAGRSGSASVIIQVGRSFGRYFGLLDDAYVPTDRFDGLFQQ